MNYRKTNHVLPPEVAATFAMLSTDTETRRAYAQALREARPALQSTSRAAGPCGRHARPVIARGSAGPATGDGFPLPTPPLKDVAVKREYVEPDPVKLARLLELQPLAQQVRSNSSNYRAEAEEYTALLDEVHSRDGVTLYRLAKRLGITHGALRFRLARYGYKAPKSGTSKVYTPILRENRA